MIEKHTKAFQQGKISRSQYQNILAGRWASVAKSGTNVSAYGQRVGTTGADLTGVFSNIRGKSGATPIDVAFATPGVKSMPQTPLKPIVRRVTAPTTTVEKLKVKRLQTVMDQYKEKTGITLPGDMTKTAPGIKSIPQTPPGSPAYAKASVAGEETYNINVTINAQTTDPKQIADEATRGVKKSIQELRKEKFNKVIRDRVAVS